MVETLSALFANTLGRLSALDSDLSPQAQSSHLFTQDQLLSTPTEELQLQIQSLLDSICFYTKSKDTSILTCYENTLQLLQSSSIMSQVLKTSDKELMQKSFFYFTESLTHLIKSFHKYPIHHNFSSQKDYLIINHLRILEELQENSLESSFSNHSEAGTELVNNNRKLMRKNEELQMTLAALEQELMASQKTCKTISLRRQESESLVRMYQQEMVRMDQQFTREIQKYNAVFRNMEEEIESLKQEADMELVEGLETRIIKMREQKERDQIIIRGLKQHISRQRRYEREEHFRYN